MYSELNIIVRSPESYTLHVVTSVLDMQNILGQPHAHRAAIGDFVQRAPMLDCLLHWKDDEVTILLFSVRLHGKL